MEQGRKLDEQELLWKLFRRLRSRLSVRHPSVLKKWEEYENDDNLIRDLSKALTTDLPPLERVLTFSMSMKLESLKRVARISDRDLEARQFKKMLCGDEIRPAHKVTMEQWNTHTVIIPSTEYSRYSRRSGTIYRHRPWTDWQWGHIIWCWELSEMFGGSLEVVLNANAIRFWGRGGQFQTKFFRAVADDSNVFINIPLDDQELSSYLVVKPRDTYPYCFDSHSTMFLKTYSHQDDSQGIKWELVIQDNLARAIEESMGIID